MQTPSPAPVPGPDPRLERNVWVVGTTSLLTDVSTEMVYPLLAPFLVLTLGATPANLGVIEGLSESTATLLRVFSGWYSDRIGRRKPVAWAGYALSSIGKVLLYLSTSWATVLVARLVERTGKGIRTAPRDALVSDSVAFDRRGFAFGVRTTMDFMGGMLGVICAWLLARQFLTSSGNASDVNGLRDVFLWALVPAGLALIVPAFLREPARPPMKAGVGGTGSGKPKPTLSMRGFSPSLKSFLLATVIFNLGNSSNQFLLLRSKDLLARGHMTPRDALLTSILFFVLFKAVVTVLGVPLGMLSDRVGRKRLVVGGYLMYSLVYALFSMAGTGAALWGLWALYGVYTALTDGLEKAMVSDLAPSEVRATALGFHGTAVGIALLPASFAAGWLYERWEGAPFVLGSVLALMATALVIFRVHLREHEATTTAA